MTRSDLIDMAVREAMRELLCANVPGSHFAEPVCATCKSIILGSVQSNWPRHLEAVKGRVG